MVGEFWGYCSMILASTVFVPLAYASTGFRSSSAISGCSVRRFDTFTIICASASMSAAGVLR